MNENRSTDLTEKETKGVREIMNSGVSSVRMLTSEEIQSLHKRSTQPRVTGEGDTPSPR